MMIKKWWEYVKKSWNTPAEVRTYYKFRYKLTLITGEELHVETSLYNLFRWEDYQDTYIFDKNSVKVDGKYINTKNIKSAELIEIPATVEVAFKHWTHVEYRLTEKELEEYGAIPVHNVQR